MGGLGNVLQLDLRLIVNDEFKYRLLEEKFVKSELENYRKWIYSGFNNLCNKNMNNKLNSEWANLDMDYLKQCFCYRFDNEDWYRIEYLKRKQPFPGSIYYTMTEGIVEDFFGAWCSESDCDEEIYNPDSDWRMIFPIP